MALFGPPSPSAPAPPVDEVASMPKEEPKEKKEVSFDVPAGFSLRGKKAGDTLQAVAVLEIKDDGTLCLESLNGIPLNPADVPAPDDAGGDFVSAVENRAAQPKS